MKTRNITIFGLDRVGASVGLALKQSSLNLPIIGHDADPERMHRAQKAGAVDSVQGRLHRAAAAADILILCLPAQEVENTLVAIGDRVQAHALVLDFSPLKAPAAKWAKEHLAAGHFVGAAPVLVADALDDGRRGVEAARADLFHNSLICLMPSPQAEPKAIETAVQVGGLLGAKPFFIDPGEYDSLVQGLDTLPGLAAAALFRTLTRSPGWRDMLRFAGLPFALATSALQDEAEIATVALHDRAATLRWLEGLVEELDQLRRWIYAQDDEQLSAYLKQLNVERERWLRERAVNEWEEQVGGQVEPLSMRQRMLGQLGGRDS